MADLWRSRGQRPQMLCPSLTLALSFQDHILSARLLEPKYQFYTERQRADDFLVVRDFISFGLYNHSMGKYIACTLDYLIYTP